MTPAKKRRYEPYTPKEERIWESAFAAAAVAMVIKNNREPNEFERMVIERTADIAVRSFQRLNQQPGGAGLCGVPPEPEPKEKP